MITMYAVVGSSTHDGTTTNVAEIGKWLLSNTKQEILIIFQYTFHKS